ncbi:MAG: FAD-binding protein [Patescibacteria group bacterium]
MTEVEQQHYKDLQIIQERMKYFFARKQKVNIYHGSTNSTRAQVFNKENLVDVSRFDRIIEINSEKQYVVVEPNVPMDKLIDATLQYNLVSPVVTELPGITVGGGIEGGAEESSSFKYGLLHNCCLEYEIILGNGEIITATPEKNSDLYWGTAASYGSLGILTLIKLRLVPIKEFIHLTYNTVRSFAEAISFVKQKTSEPVNYIDGIMFSKNFGVIMTGTITGISNLPISTFNKSTDEWFYLHALKISNQHEKYEELIPIRDYLFRYDRGAFWMGRYGFKLLKLPFTRVSRFIFDSICNTRTLYRLFHKSNLSQSYFIQDFNIPSKNTLEFLETVDKELQIYPIWICPLKPGKQDKLSANCITTDLVFNIGVWGEAKKDFSDFVKLNRYFEQKSFELGGRKMLYAHSYYPSDDFWKVYDLKWYLDLRTKYHSINTFPSIYKKTLVSEKYKSSLFNGIWNLFLVYKLPTF